MSYASFLTHLNMLQDRVRTEALQRAISAVVRPGDHVLDFGSGSGVLSVFAERAGAEQVYALERSSLMAAASRHVFAANGCERILNVPGEGAVIKLPGPVDVIVSEWMGHFLFAEQMFEPLLRLRDDYLRPGGRMLPAKFTLHVGLVTLAAPFESLNFLRTKPYGVDFGVIADGVMTEVDSISFGPEHVLPAPEPIGALDMLTVQRMPGHLTGSVPIERDGVAYGICGWFDSELGGGVDLSTSPFEPETHWKQLFFPFDAPLPLKAAETVEIELDVLPHPQSNHFTWRAVAGREERRGDNVLLEAWLMR